MQIWKKSAGRLKTKTPGPASQAPVDSKIELSQSAGLIRVLDPRIFRADRRQWCHTVAETAASRQGVRAVRVDLETATCEIQFASAPLAHTMADVLAASMRAADESSPGPCVSRRSWFNWRSPEPETWSSLTAFPRASHASIWKTRLREPGLIEIDHGSMSGSRADQSRLVDGLLARAIGLSSCRVDRRTRRLEVRFEPGRFELAQLIEAAEEVLTGTRTEHAVLDAELLPARSDAEPTMLVAGPKRLLFLGLGGGSFALIFVGLAIPGIPTVPFVMLSSYYLARSSTRLHAQLVRSRFFGPIVRDWSIYRGLSRTSKVKLTVLTLAVVGVSLLLVGLTPIVLSVTFVLSAAGLYSLIRLPGVHEDNQLAPSSFMTRSLPAPSI